MLEIEDLLSIKDIWNMFRKSQPEYEFYCKCHDEQFHGFVLLNLRILRMT